MTPALAVEGVGVGFGDVRALRDVTLSIEAGTVTGLIGPNGAGKTTLLDVVSGFISPSSGQVWLEGHRLDSLPPHRRAALGLGRTFQSLELFDDMTVAENIRVAHEAATSDAALHASSGAASAVGLDPADSRLAAEVSHGTRKRLALARALAGGPKVLLLDEPAAGLDPEERRHLVGVLRDVAAAGAAVLLVDHDLGLVLDACDRVVVLDLGSVIADGSPQSVRADPAVAAAYVGTATMTVTTSATTSASAPTARAAAAAVGVRGMSAGYGGARVLTDIDLDVGTGEIVTLLGPNGAGKTTTLLALSGVLPDVHGDVEVLGRPVKPGGHRRGSEGVAHVLQRQRVFAGLTVGENLRLADRRGDATADVLDLLPALKPLLRTPAGRLSGGEQQMLAVARALARRPRLLLVDELSLGLAPRLVTDLLATLATLSRESGTAVLLAEQHAELALGIADRAYVLVAGRIVHHGPAAALAGDPQHLARLYLGGTKASGGPPPPEGSVDP